MTGDLLQTAAELARRGEPAVLATVVWRRGPSSGQIGSRGLVHADGRMQGWVGGACAEPTVVREALRCLEEGTARLVHLAPPEDLPDPAPEGAVCVPIACESEGALQVYLEPLLPSPHLVVVGRTPAARALVAMARVLGWRTALVDDSAGEPPDADADVVVAALDLAAAGAAAGSLIVVATQGHYDEDALEAALAVQDPGYIGLVASARRAASVRERLAERGVPGDRLEAIRAPAGLDLGSTSHTEIAVAILAELVRLRAAGQIGSAGPVTAPPRQDVTDPVCGMTVDLAATRHTAEHGGRTFGFCCPGCRQAFLADPDRYASVGA